MRKKEVLASIQNGIRLGCHSFSKWSEGHTINDYGAEGILVTHICGQIGRVLAHEPGRYLTVEEAFWNIDAGTEKRGRKPKILSDQNRVDICLWNDVSPVAVIEVKRKFDDRSCTKDVRRVEALLDRYGRHNGGTLQFGCFAFPTVYFDPVPKEQFGDIRSTLEANAAEFLGHERAFLQEWVRPFTFKEGIVPKAYSLGNDIKTIEYPYNGEEYSAILGISGVMFDLESAWANEEDFNS